MVEARVMLLEEFIKKSGMKKKSFAESVGISTTNLWKILKGITRPSLKTAQRIEEFTEGRVSMQEMLFGKSSKKLNIQPSLEKRISELETKVKKLEVLLK
ncbi:MAG: helix-turn-helix transcriptional regulator [Simkaniaceae bacterium]|jgi:transcriptional regulator with XRE-family HTH domain|nr:MAG: helix-turn-helix transcriptional regulator [Simkaniaceae bacterium]